MVPASSWVQVFQFILQIIIGWPTLVATGAAAYMLWQVGSLDWLVLGVLFVLSTLFFVKKVREWLVSSFLREDAEQYSLVVRGLMALVAVLFVYSVYVQFSLREIRKELDCYVTPRRLTLGQIEAVSSYLKKYDPHDTTVTFITDDDEVANYAEDFRRAFAEGNWRVENNPVSIVDVINKTRHYVPPGIKLEYNSNEKTQHADNKRRPQDPPPPGEIMKEAFKALRMGFIVYSMDPKLEDNIYRIVLTIGSRPSSLCAGKA